MLTLSSILCHLSWAQGARRQQAPKRPQTASEGFQAVEKKVKLFEMVAKSFMAAIDAADYKTAFGMISERPQGPVLTSKSNNADAQRVRESAFEEFTAYIKNTPAFQSRSRIHYGDVLFSDDEVKRGEVHTRITRKDGDVCDIVWSISEAQDGWKINYFVAGRRFPPNYP